MVLSYIIFFMCGWFHCREIMPGSISSLTTSISSVALDFGFQVRRLFFHFLARDVIYTSRAYATMSVSFCLSVCPSVCDGSALAHYS